MVTAPRLEVLGNGRIFLATTYVQVVGKRQLELLSGFDRLANLAFFIGTYSVALSMDSVVHVQARRSDTNCVCPSAILCVRLALMESLR